MTVQSCIYMYIEYFHMISQKQYSFGETAVMLVFQINPVGTLFLCTCANTFLCSSKFAWLLAMCAKTL